MNRGKLVILFIFGLSAVMGAYAWWHHYTQGRRCLALWGAEAAELIRYAPHVEVIKVTIAEADGAETIQIESKPHAIVARTEITGTPGLVHARQALIEDASFLWQSRTEGPSQWEYVLRFTRGDRRVDVAFDWEEGRVRLAGSDQQATLTPSRTNAYQARLPKWLGLESDARQF